MSAQVDKKELAKFHKQSTHWWDPYGPLKTLHALNPARFELIASHTSLKEASVLDIGCGGGILSESLAKAGAYVTGIDANESLISVAKAHAKQSSLDIHYQTGTIHDLIKKSKLFDAITCLELLEHVPDPAQIIKDCSALLKPKGMVFFSTLNRNPKAYLKAIILGEYILKLLPKGTHSYQSFIKPSELHAIAIKEKLRLITLKGMDYNPHTNKATLSNKVTVNYIIAYQKI